jgi:hypothetical protein
MYTVKACEIYKIPLTIINIPKVDAKILTEDLKRMMIKMKTSRSIDIQCSYVFDKMIPHVATKDLVLGFHNSALYNSGKANAVNYNNYRKKLITKEAYEAFYLERRKKFLNRNNNHFTLRTFIESYGLKTHSPYLDEELLKFSHTLKWHDFHTTESGKVYSKYFLYELWKPYFDAVGNSKNKHDMHVESGIKTYFIDTLVTNTRYHSLPGALNGIYKSINVQRLF